MKENRKTDEKVIKEFMPSLIAHESMETYPVEFSIEGVRYRVPRNYLKYMQNWQGGPQDGVTMEVLYPGLLGRTPETLPYFEKKKDGLIIEIFMSIKTLRSRGPVDLTVIGKLRPEKLYGFDHYIQGPPHSETHHLIKHSKHGILSTYFFVNTTDEWNYKIANLSTATAINDRNEYHFFLNHRYLPQFEDINNALYDMILSFTVTE
jgi:hypothetical protein